MWERIMLILLAIAAVVAVVVAVVVALRMSRRLAKLRTEAQRAREETEELRAVAAAQRSSLLDALADAVLILDSDRQVRLANAAARSIFRRPDLIGRVLTDMVVSQTLVTALDQGLSSGEKNQRDIILSGQETKELLPEHRNGETAWQIDCAPVSGFSDDFSARVVIRNITDAHRAEQVRKDFVANASHELRTPLTIIGGYLEGFLEDGISDELANGQLKVMARHLERINRIVEDMLVISRLESGAVSAISPTEFSIAESFQDIAERVDGLLSQNDAKLKLAISPAEAVLVADQFYFTQVLFNLVENAIKQNTDRKLRVCLEAEQDELGTTVSVIDDGAGIPSADLQHIFRRFYRVQKSHSQNKIKGTGLGLSIVKRAIEAHGGTVKVTSKPGVETKFVVWLPATPADPLPAPAEGL